MRRVVGNPKRNGCASRNSNESAPSVIRVGISCSVRVCRQRIPLRQTGCNEQIIRNSSPYQSCALIRDHSRHVLPKTHEILIFRCDVSDLSPQEIIAALRADLDANSSCNQAFVYVAVHGTMQPNQLVSKTEIAAALRERDLFDYFIDLHYSTQSKSARESRPGASIEQILKREFPRKRSYKSSTSHMTKARASLFPFGSPF